MELIQELVLTAVVAALLSFFVAKLVSIAAAGDPVADSEISSGKSSVYPASAVEEVKFEGRLRTAGVVSEARVHFVEKISLDKIDRFGAEQVALEEAEVEEKASSAQEIGIECCYEHCEPPLVSSGEEVEDKVSVEKRAGTEPSDAPDESPESMELPDNSLESIDLPEQSVERAGSIEMKEEASQCHVEEDKQRDMEGIELEKPSAQDSEELQVPEGKPEPEEFHEEIAKTDIDEDDWEGIERSELEKEFAVAAKYFGSGDSSDSFGGVGSEVKMQLYGLHKVATEGPCHEPQPMALKVTARAKWNAWQRLGNMTPDAAMEQYITLLSESVPTWKVGKSSGETEADVLTPATDLSTISVHQTNIKEDRIASSNSGLGKDAITNDESLVTRGEE